MYVVLLHPFTAVQLHMGSQQTSEGDFLQQGTGKYNWDTDYVDIYSV